jgi:BirA family biotin operon repressor/biotin-[acetyl-CoA-carboxylase] ligase
VTRALDDEALLPLVDALAAGDWQSGETLAAAAGVTRAALAKRITQIEAWGLDIEARTGLGYRLAVPLERLDADALRAALPPAAAARLRGLAVALRVDSTNQRLLEAPGSDDPQALFAEAQTAGRGRRGRDWRSPFGANVYLSLAWSFAGWPPKLGCLPLAVGVAACRALAACGLPGVQLKWPNDLKLGDLKLGGILIESRSEIGGPCRVIVGLGLNVSMSAAQAAALGQPWVSVHAAQDALGVARVARPVLAAAVLDALVAALAAFEQDGFASFAADWARLDQASGRRVVVTGLGETFEGTAQGIDDDGALRVEVGNGSTRSLHAGEISVRLEPVP